MDVEKLSEAAKKRLVVWADMTPDLQKVAEAFERAASTESKFSLLTRFTLGMRIRAALQMPHLYGERAVAQLAAYLGTTTDDLYALRNLTTVFCKEEIEKLALRVMDNGGRISYSHLLVLMREKGSAKRAHFIERLFTESMSVRELESAVALTTDREPSKAGRKPKPPKTPLAAAGDMLNAAERFGKKLPVWTRSIDGIRELPPTQINGVLRSKVLAAQGRTQLLQKELAALQDQFIAPLERIDRVLKLQEKKAAVAAAAKPKAAKPGSALDLLDDPWATP